MKWNGMVSQFAKKRIAARFTAEKAPQAMSSGAGRMARQPPDRRLHASIRPSRRELITLTAHCPDQVEAELGAEPPDAHIDHVRPRIEVEPPHRRDQSLLLHVL